MFVLLHSPLVGPGSWRLVAEELRRHGMPVLTPSLAAIEMAAPPRWRAAAEAVARSRSSIEDYVLVGHSGAGLLLPVIGGVLPVRPTTYVFVDSGVPPVAGRIDLAPASFKAFLRRLASSGRLPPWSKWWPPDVMDGMLPRGPVRDAFEAELPRLPIAYFDEQPEVPSGWSRTPCGYLQLSPAYDEDAADGKSRGWPVVRLDGRHLDILVRPRLVADSLVRLVEGLVADSVS